MEPFLCELFQKFTVSDWIRLVSSGFVVVQIFIGLLIFHTQSKRSKINHTIEYLDDVNTTNKELWYSVKGIQGFGDDQNFIQYVNENDDAQKLVHGFLNAYDRLGYGVLRGTYDLLSVTELHGKLLVMYHQRLNAYIEHRRKNYNERAWRNFSLLVERIKNKRKDLRA